MTNYEKKVKEGDLQPMNGMDWLMLGVTIEDTLSGNYTMDESLLEIFTDMKDEIDHYLKNEPDKLKQLEELIKKYKDARTN